MFPAGAMHLKLLSLLNNCRQRWLGGHILRSGALKIDSVRPKAGQNITTLIV